MGTQFAWFLDVVVIGVIVAMIYLGGKRGFIKSAILIAGYVVAFTGAYVVSGIVAPVIYEKAFESKAEELIKDHVLSIDVKSQIRDQMKKAGVDVDIPDAELDKIINSGSDLSTGIAEYAKSEGVETSAAELRSKIESAITVDKMFASVNNERVSDIIEISEKMVIEGQESINTIIVTVNNPDKDYAAQKLSDDFVRPLLVGILRLILILVVFVILRIVVKLLAGLFSGFNKIPVAGSINALGGAALGAVQGLVIICIVTLILKIIIMLTTNDLLVFNEPTIDRTFIFKHFYNIKF